MVSILNQENLIYKEFNLKNSYSALYLSSYIPQSFSFLEVSTGHVWRLVRSGRKFKLNNLTNTAKLSIPITIGEQLSRDEVIKLINISGIDYKSINLKTAPHLVNILEQVSSLTPAELSLYSKLQSDIKDVAGSLTNLKATRFRSIKVGQEKYCTSQRIDVEFLTTISAPQVYRVPLQFYSGVQITVLPFDTPLLQIIIHSLHDAVDNYELLKVFEGLKDGLISKGYSFL